MVVMVIMTMMMMMPKLVTPSCHEEEEEDDDDLSTYSSPTMMNKPEQPYRSVVSNIAFMVTIAHLLLMT